MSSPFIGIKACVFDAYGTLFDVHSAVDKHHDKIGHLAKAVSASWRAKQLEYTWLRTLLKRYVDFWQITADSLDYALESHQIHDEQLRDNLLNAYLHLSCYPEVRQTLETLKTMGLQNAILSNGSPMMLQTATDHAGITHLIDQIISIDELSLYKPSASTYQLAMDKLQLGRAQISFQSSNAWDVAGAAVFGFRVVWCNRFNQARERLPGIPDAQIKTLAKLPALLKPA